MTLSRMLYCSNFQYQLTQRGACLRAGGLPMRTHSGTATPVSGSTWGGAPDAPCRSHAGQPPPAANGAAEAPAAAPGVAHSAAGARTPSNAGDGAEASPAGRTASGAVRQRTPGLWRRLRERLLPRRRPRGEPDQAPAAASASSSPSASPRRQRACSGGGGGGGGGSGSGGAAHVEAWRAAAATQRPAGSRCAPPSMCQHQWPASVIACCRALAPTSPCSLGSGGLLCRTAQRGGQCPRYCMLLVQRRGAHHGVLATASAAAARARQCIPLCARSLLSSMLSAEYLSAEKVQKRVAKHHHMWTSAGTDSAWRCRDQQQRRQLRHAPRGQQRRRPARRHIRGRRRPSPGPRARRPPQGPKAALGALGARAPQRARRQHRAQPSALPQAPARRPRGDRLCVGRDRRVAAGRGRHALGAGGRSGRCAARRMRRGRQYLPGPRQVRRAGGPLCARPHACQGVRFVL
jgi:hypothetical protein